MPNLKFERWFQNQKKINKINTKIINLSELDKWNSNTVAISHDSKKFFKVVNNDLLIIVLLAV